MKKTNIVIAAIMMVALCSTRHANAQMQLGITAGAAVPMGSFAAAPTVDFVTPNLVGTASAGFGVTLFGKYWLDDRMNVGLNIGYVAMGGQDITSPLFGTDKITGKFMVMPITLDYEYYFKEDGLKPFVGAEVGFIRTTAKHVEPKGFSSTGSEKTITNTASGLVIAPVLGVAYGVSDQLDILLNLKYVIGMNERKFDKNPGADDNVGFPATTYLGINLGIAYKLGN